MLLSMFLRLTPHPVVPSNGSYLSPLSFQILRNVLFHVVSLKKTQNLVLCLVQALQDLPVPQISLPIHMRKKTWNRTMINFLPQSLPVLPLWLVYFLHELGMHGLCSLMLNSAKYYRVLIALGAL